MLNPCPASDSAEAPTTPSAADLAEHQQCERHGTSGLRRDRGRKAAGIEAIGRQSFHVPVG